MVPQRDDTIPRRATYDDYLQFPDDGKRYEIVDGRIFVTPAPSTRHQFASKRLQRMLEDYFEHGRDALVFDAPLDVVLSNEDVVQPDLAVVSRAQMSRRGIEGPPMLVVEILSPSRPDYDRVTKAGRYAVLGVPHYWIVDPEAHTLECFRLDGGEYHRESSGTGDDSMSTPFEGLTVSLGSLWLEWPA